MFIIFKPTEFRNNIVGKIEEIITRMENPRIVMDEINGNKLSTNIEKGVYNYAINEATNRKIIKKWENKYFVQIYIDRLKTVIYNIKTTPQLVEKLISGDITSEVFAFMSHQEMHPEKWNELIALKIKRDESKYVNRVEASTDMYQCRKCKSRKCTYYSVQLRSADEPMTTLVSCLECSYNWKN